MTRRITTIWRLLHHDQVSDRRLIHTGRCLAPSAALGARLDRDVPGHARGVHGARQVPRTRAALPRRAARADGEHQAGRIDRRYDRRRALRRVDADDRNGVGQRRLRLPGHGHAVRRRPAAAVVVVVAAAVLLRLELSSLLFARTDRPPLSVLSLPPARRARTYRACGSPRRRPPSRFAPPRRPASHSAETALTGAASCCSRAAPRPPFVLARALLLRPLR